MKDFLFAYFPSCRNTIKEICFQMELSDRTVEVHTALTIPDFAAYSPGHEALTCPKFLTIEGVRAKFLITVELFSSKRKGPPSSPRAPTRRDTPLGAPSTPRKASPMPRGVTRVGHPPEGCPTQGTASRRSSTGGRA